MENGHWKRFLFQILFGLGHLFLFILPQAVKAEGYDSIQVIEYYFDQDPGIGLGIKLETDSTPAYVTNDVIDISGLENGMHTLYLRSQDSTGIWGVPCGKTFYSYRLLETDSTNVPLANLEFSFDSITGFSSLGEISQDTSVLVSANLELTQGMHTVYFRSSDTSSYIGSMVPKTFFVYEKTKGDSANVPVANLEYSIDSITGFSSLGEISQDTSALISANLELTTGMHTVYFRSSDTSLYIGSMVPKTFFAYEKTRADLANVPITDIEFSFDSITGFRPMGSFSADTVVELAGDLIQHLAGHGDHNILFRAKDENDFYSNVITGAFNFENEPPVADAGADRFVAESTLVQLDGSVSADPNRDQLSYHWTAPDGISLSSNSDAKPTFTAPEIIDDSLLTFYLYVDDGLLDSPVDTVLIIVIHDQIVLSDSLFMSEIADCINAFSTITVAGDGESVIFASGSSTELIASQSIRFLPGFHAESGSDMNAYITTNGSFCDQLLQPLGLAAPVVEKSIKVQDEIKNKLNGVDIKVYPNPNNGQFKITVSGARENQTEVYVYNLLGNTVYSGRITSSSVNKISLGNVSQGLYMVKIFTGDNSLTCKLVVK